MKQKTSSASQIDREHSGHSDKSMNFLHSETAEPTTQEEGGNPMKTFQIYPNFQATNRPGKTKLNVIATTLFATLALGIVAIIVAWKSMPDYREYKVDLGDGSTAVIRTSLNWKLQEQEDSVFPPVHQKKLHPTPNFRCAEPNRQEF